MMNILFLYTSPWWNAAAYYAVSLAKGLQAAGSGVIWGGVNGTPAFQEVANTGISTVHIPFTSLNPSKIVRSAAVINRICRTNSIKVINCHSPQAVIPAYIAKRFIRKPVIQVRTRSDDRDVQNNAFNKWTYLKANDGIIFPSEAAYKKFQRLLDIPPVLTATIHGGLDIQQFRQYKNSTLTRAELNIPENHIIIGHIARFSPVKGHKTLLKAFKLLTESLNCATLLISGEDAQYTARDFELCAKEYGIDHRVKVLPRQIDPRMILPLIDIGVIPSQFSEIICRTAVEFMAYRIPLIVSDVNVLPEMVRVENGIVVPKDDVQKWSEAMKRLCSDTMARQELGNAGLRIAEKNFDIAVVVDKTIAAFRQFGVNA